jgi:magnesium-transporting ATPase (P-type)
MFKIMSSAPIFSLRIPEVFQSLETTKSGLDTAEAVTRRALYKENLLTDQPHTPKWVKYIQQVRHPFVVVMILTALLALWEGDKTLALIILLLSLINGGFSFWREHRAEQAVEKLRRLLPTYAHVIRDGSEQHIQSGEIVPGDVLILAEGDNIAADARVVEEYGLRVNNASLTGESVAARKNADASFMAGISDLERPNLIFAGTSVASGTGKAVVYATGMLTQFGRIAHLTQSVRDEPSPFQKELERIGRILTYVAVGVGAVVWLVTRYNPDISSMYENPFLLAVGTIVAVTPEGLPATLTLSLAVAVQRLATRGVLAKRLSSVETLGNISVICTDKSGTLTQNQMTVREIWSGRNRIQVSGAGYEPKGTFTPSPSSPELRQDLTALLEAAVCCNNSRINSPTSASPTWTSLGDQTEVAMKVAALKFGLDEDELGTLLPRVHEIPFDAHRKRMATIHRTREGEIAFVKGAPREVLQLCNTLQVNGKIRPLDEALRAEILAATDDYARRALRVLAVSRRDLPQRSGAYTAEQVEQGLTFLGLMGMMDPPRPEVEKAIQACRQAGIRIVMITGDYGLTAESLARRVGMVTSPNPAILTGAELDEMNDAALGQFLEKETIFARMAPDHKLRLVSAYQARGDVVAVTGDGVNDAPALRKADIGIAMGLIGTDVAKEAADIILTDDNFGAIVAAIEEGRAIYANIRKFITYIFSSNVAEVLPFLLTSAIGIPAALTVRQILAIDMGTDLLPALALGMEKPEPDIMLHPPHFKSQHLLDRSLLVRAFLWLGLLEACMCYLGYLGIFLFSGNASLLNLDFLNAYSFPHLFTIGGDVSAVARTIFLAGMVMAQIGNAFACRTSKARNTQMGWGSNLALLGSVALGIGILLCIIYIPPFADAFNNQMFPSVLWGVLILYAPALYSLEWLRKGLARRSDRVQEAHASETGERR